MPTSTPPTGSKRCSTCREVKPLSEFNRLRKAKDGRQYNCRECNRKYHYDNWDRHMSQIRARKRRQIAIAREELIRYLRKHPCVDCGEPDPVVLEFDHVRDKEAEIGYLIRGGYSWERILDEVAKCEVVCANCHRRRTFRRQGSYRHRHEDLYPPDAGPT